jgi:hypothetical protein
VMSMVLAQDATNRDHLLAMPLRFSSGYPSRMAPLATQRKQADSPQVTEPKRSSQSFSYLSTT